MLHCLRSIARRPQAAALAAAAMILCSTPMRAQTPPAIAQTSAIAPLSEQELRQQLLNKTFYLRGGYLGDSLHFDAEGKLDGNAPHASYTLSLVEITRVRLGKHRLELEGVRYGLHFLGALASEDQSTAFDKVRLTPNKKPLRITIDREQPEKPKKEKTAKKKSAAISTKEQKPAEASRNSNAHPDQLLRAALDRTFAAEIDDRMMASLPEFWQLYYRAVAARADYRPTDRAVLRQNQVDRKAKLLTIAEPASNEWAQANGVAGVAMYHVVVAPDGKAQEIAVGRPIGFGLDENAVAAIRKATFQPALKDGKPVPVELDVLVQFRIYSKLTAEAAKPVSAPAVAQPQQPVLPGPYSVPRSQ